MPVDGYAIDTFWSNNRGDFSGTFSVASNWSPSVPGTSDVAHFGKTTSSLSPATYTVNFTNDPTNLRLRVEDDQVTFDLNSHFYQATSPIAIEVGTESGRTGQLTITDGVIGTPLGADIHVGAVAGAAGVLNVTTGGLVLGSPDVVIGRNSNGALNIGNNGDIIASDVTLGMTSSVTGTATITGGGSSLLADQVVVGAIGTGTLNITASGRVDSTDAIIGNAASGTGTVTVSGANSRWQISRQLDVGSSGQASLRIEDGGTVRDDVALVRGSVVVTGGSTWISTSVLNLVTNSLTNGQLTIESGSHVESGNSNVGIGSGQTSAVVRGAGTTWTNTSALNVGLGGQGDLTIESGAAVTSVGGAVAVSGGSSGVARINGSTSIWTTSGDFAVGSGGTGELQVNSAQFVFTNSSALSVGGKTGFLIVSSGGRVLDAMETVIGDGQDSYGDVTVTGSGSLMRTLGELRVGNSGQGLLLINGGGRVTNQIGIISGTSSRVRVQGANSVWENGGVLNLFKDAEVIIEDGGTVLSAGSGISGGSGQTSQVTVSNATWTNSGYLEIGGSGKGRMTIEASGRVSNVNASVATFSDTNGEVFIRGVGAEWINSGGLTVGERALGTLDVAGGGSIESTVGSIGDETNGIGIVSVAGSNSKWVATNALFVGNHGQGVVDIGPGGLVQSATFALGVSPGGLGNVLVDGSNARLNTPNSLFVGALGTGVINVTAGGRVSSGLAFIGQDTGSTGTVRVTGTGSLWTISERLYVGGNDGGTNGGAGTLRVQFGGTVSVGHDIDIFAGDQVILEGGTLSTSAINFNGGGTFSWTSGTLHLGAYRGSITTPNDGILAPGNSVGQTSIDGNYSQQNRGTLEIEIGGPTSADLVSITGVASFSGNLQLKLLNGFLPNAASNFVVFESRGINDAFLNVANGQRLTTSDGLGSFLVHYGNSSAFDPTQIVLSNFLAAGIPGDYNQNGIVDAADYTVWRNNLGSSTSLPNDDTPGVGQDDYNRWKSHFGESASSGADSGAYATVPEPATYIFLLTVIATMFAPFRCSRKLA